MTGEEVRKLTDEELGVELQRLRSRVFTLRTQTVTEKVEDNTQMGKSRRDIARLLTERAVRNSKATSGAGATKK